VPLCQGSFESQKKNDFYKKIVYLSATHSILMDLVHYIELTFECLFCTQMVPYISDSCFFTLLVYHKRIVGYIVAWWLSLFTSLGCRNS